MPKDAVPKKKNKTKRAQRRVASVACGAGAQTNDIACERVDKVECTSGHRVNHFSAGAGATLRVGTIAASGGTHVNTFDGKPGSTTVIGSIVGRGNAKMTFMF